jgi:hypothetical protein
MIYVDLDGVIFDFAKAAFKVFGKEYNEKEYPAVNDISKALGVSPRQFWDKVDHHGVGFWAYLETYDWCDELLTFIEEKSEQLNTDWRFLSSPSKNPSCAMGKVESLQKLFGPDFRKYILAPAIDKQLLCSSPEDILIDDRQLTIEQWNRRGGKGILFPQPWNDAWPVSDRMEYIKSNPLFGE